MAGITYLTSAITIIYHLSDLVNGKYNRQRRVAQVMGQECSVQATIEWNGCSAVGTALRWLLSRNEGFGVEGEVQG